MQAYFAKLPADTPRRLIAPGAFFSLGPNLQLKCGFKANRVGSIAVGKSADLVVIAGDPATRIGDVRNVQIVFKQGVGYDPAKLVESVRGKVGLF